MNRSELEAYITEIYNTEGKHLFDQYPSFLVFRHSENREEYDANESPGMIYVIFSCRFSIRFQLTNPYRSLTRNITKQIITER